MAIDESTDDLSSGTIDSSAEQIGTEFLLNTPNNMLLHPTQTTSTPATHNPALDQTTNPPDHITHQLTLTAVTTPKSILKPVKVTHFVPPHNEPSLASELADPTDKTDASRPLSATMDMSAKDIAKLALAQAKLVPVSIERNETVTDLTDETEA